MSSSKPEAPTFAGLGMHFFLTVYRSAPGKLLLSTWGGYLLLLATLKKKKNLSESELKVASDSKENSSDDKENEKKQVKKKKAKSLQQVIKILRKFAKPEHIGYFVAYVLSLCSRIFITVKLADLGGILAGYMGARKWDKMFVGQAWFGLVCLVASGVTASMKYLERQCAFSTREILFEYLKDRYLNKEHMRYYHQDINDASARLTADLNEFSVEAVHLVGHFLKPALDMSYLSLVMLQRIGAPSVAIFYAFFWFCDFSVNRVRRRLLPKSLKQVALEKQERESNLRESLNRIHHYREQIAMQKGTEREYEAVSQQFKDIKRGTKIEDMMYGFIDCIQSYTIKYGGMMCAFSVLTPAAYLDPSKSGETITAGFMTNSNLLGSLAGAVKDMAESFGRLPKVSGLASRVFELEQKMRLIDQRQNDDEPKVAVNDKGDSFRIKNISISPPLPVEEDAKKEDKLVLIPDLSFEVNEGDHFVVRGPNGVGKSSLFRTMTGLWPAAPAPRVPGEKREPEITIPESLFVVPQDSYFPNKTSLRAQITYPLCGDKINEDVAASLLCEVGLEDIVDRYSVDEVADWANVLSGGQKQRLSWARLFFHSPKFALLDEATSAISVDYVSKLFKLAKDKGITLFTISHSPEVDQHHKRALDLKKGGNYSISQV